MSLLADLRTPLLLLHLLGFAVGTGAAVTTDLLTFLALQRPERAAWMGEMLHVSSRLILAALGVIAVSGLLLYLPEAERLNHASKFQVKVVVVAIIALNGALFHWRLAPRLGELLFGEGLSPGASRVMPPPATEAALRRLAFAVGAVSGTSWFSALLLGGLEAVPLPFGKLLSVYLTLLLLAVAASQLLERRSQQILAQSSRSTVRKVASQLLDEVEVYQTLFSRPRR